MKKKKNQKLTIKDVAEKLDKVSLNVEKLSTNVDDLTEIVKEGFVKMVSKTEFNERIDDLEVEVSPLGRRMDRLEDKIRKINTKIGLDE